MGKKKLLFFIICVCLVLSILSYELLFNQSLSGNDDPSPTATPTSTVSPSISPTNQATSTPTPTSSGTPSVTSNPTSQPTTQPTEAPVLETSVPHEPSHEKASDYIWQSTEIIDITLSGNSIFTSMTNTSTIEGSKITITSAGTYRVSGSLTNGQVVVDTQDKDTVRLLLNNVDITCSNSAPVYVISAKKVIIVLQEGTVNNIKDTNRGDTVEPNAAIFSACDLTIYGSGQLNVQGNTNDAIASKDGLIIKSGMITANSVDDCIRGKDYLIIKDGSLTLTASGDGLKSDNVENASCGYIDIENGIIRITSGMDAIDARTDVTITGGQFTLTSGGGSTGIVGPDVSAKGIKGLVNLTITNGNFVVSSADDNLHSNRTITIYGGTFSLSTGDDAIHADNSIVINGGTIDIPKSYEGIESTNITINDAIIHITSSDDGLNGAGGNDGSGFQPGPGVGQPGQFFVPGNRHLYINGGYIVVTADGDGIDVNGPISMTAGYVIINGPTSFMNTAIDWEGSFTMSGGFILGVGSAGTSMAPAMTTGPTSTQNAILLNFRTTKNAGTIFHIQENDGTEVVTYLPIKQYQSIALCSPLLVKGSSYEVYFGGSSSGTIKDGVYLNGAYTPGNRNTNFTITNTVTKLVNL